MDTSSMAVFALPTVRRVLTTRAPRERPLPAVHEGPGEALEASDTRLVERDAEPAARVAHAGRAQNELAYVPTHARSIRRPDLAG